MKIYIEKDGEFYHWPLWFFCDDPYDYTCDDETKTTKRDFEIGARVYFEGIGWTEVVKDTKKRRCHDCALDKNEECSGIACRSGERSDRFFSVFKKLENLQEPTESTPDPVSHPTHYTGRVPGIECIQVTQWFNFNRGNAIKYLWRAGEKDKAKEKEDLLKARQYIDFELKRLEEEAGGK